MTGSLWMRTAFGRAMTRLFTEPKLAEGAGRKEVRLRAARLGGQPSLGLPAIAHAQECRRERRMVRKRGLEPAGGAAGDAARLRPRLRPSEPKASDGAEERTRTSTTFRPLAPESCESSEQTYPDLLSPASSQLTSVQRGQQ